MNGRQVRERMVSVGSESEVVVRTGGEEVGEMLTEGAARGEELLATGCDSIPRMSSSCPPAPLTGPSSRSPKSKSPISRDREGAGDARAAAGAGAGADVNSSMSHNEPAVAAGGAGETRDEGMGDGAAEKSAPRPQSSVTGLLLFLIEDLEEEGMDGDRKSSSADAGAGLAFDGRDGAARASRPDHADAFVLLDLAPAIRSRSACAAR
jgi:hypothetical protein